MPDTDTEVFTRRSQWRELCRSVIDHEILYFISSSPEGVRETKIKNFMQEVFKFSFHGSIESHMTKLESEGLITKESTRSGARIWHANQPLVIDLVQKERDELKHRESELRDLHEYLIDLYRD